MKLLQNLAFISALAALISSCSAPNDPAPLPTGAENYFFQQNAAFQYTYSEDNLSSPDVSTYGVKSTYTYGSFFSLVKQDQSASDTLLLFKNETSLDGSTACILSNSPGDAGFVALKGTMDLGASWIADAKGSLQATIVGKYAEYYLPGRQVHYSDVVVVKYVDKNAPPENYVVRYFARDFGLILERVIMGPTSEVTRLQLLSRQNGTSGVNGDTRHDRWYNANGRYSVHMKTDDDLKK